jgi:hypothetical protein
MGAVSFVWDVAQNGGYMLSEALQGYAPIASNLRFTNVAAKAAAGGSTPERVEGHWCEQQELVVSSSDGAAVEFRVWRAADLKGFPLRINWATNSTSCAVSFSKLQLKAPPSELFSPPDGFTKYESPEAMMNELLLRQQSIRRGFSGGAGSLEPGDGREGHRSRGGR